jgi:hypothetical protein
MQQWAPEFAALGEYSTFVFSGRVVRTSLSNSQIEENESTLLAKPDILFKVHPAGLGSRRRLSDQECHVSFISSPRRGWPGLSMDLLHILSDKDS